MSLRKRDALIGFVCGTVITFGLNIWFNVVATPANIEDYLWLARLQEPGAKLGEKIAWSLYPVIGYPWNVRLAVPCGYGVLIVLWTLAVFALVKIGRSAHNAFLDRQAQH
jgi:hypothetical protein